ncbi:MAG: polyprenol monophosphomannose synthase [Candidatus Altiarchaeales archaeon]|nr:MAG: polyprenol monophosphomannose synthase [Candidatus Altiarchaeales archaeon]HDO82796.1 polyprenol monophosphomannose synthase [Candidatus Altiarchaeales archaeon]HEX55445.1 polyprenol monophosphomannose synthase [Candidatus Altiarchaeales archaeon]
MISPIIPTYNERENIKVLIPEIFKVFEENGIEGNLIIVDDNSPDGTALEVKKLEEKYPITLIKRNKKLGIGSAYTTGFKLALERKADIVFEMDADLSHNPREIPNFVKNLNKYDVVIGSRYVKGGKIDGWSLWRKIISRGANSIARIMLGLNIRDITSGYRAYKSEVLESIELDKIKSNGYAFQAEILFMAKENGFRIKEIPIEFIDRRKGKSKLSWIEIVNFFILCTKLCLDRIIR